MQEQFSTSGTNQAARECIERGWTVRRADLYKKQCYAEGWNKMVIGLEGVDEEFTPGVESNLVRINGTLSGGAGDLDLDCDEAIRVAQGIIHEPEGGLRRFGREGKEPGHIDIVFEDTVPRTRKFEVPGDNGKSNMLCELRAEGSQTMIPPSIYPEGDRCVWHDGEPLRAHSVTLQELAEDIAAAALTLRNYPGVGARQEYMMGLVGLLVRNKVSIERVRRIVYAAGRSAGDDQLETRLKLIDQTYNKWLKGGNVAGRKKLVKFDKAMSDLLEEWLGNRLGIDSGLPQILVTDSPLRDCSDAATDALVAANDPPELFARSGELARLAQNSDGKSTIQLVDKDRLRHRMTRTAEFIKVTKRGPEHCFPPTEVVADVMAAKAHVFDELVGITEVPMLRKSGTVLDRVGYDWESKMVFSPEDTLEYKVPETPTFKQVNDSLELLKEVITDFPFVDQASIANCLALLITPAVRPVYDSTTPLTVINKPRMGTGASLIAECVSLLYTGQRFHPNHMPQYAEEARKQITSILLTGRPIVVLDNVEEEVGGAAWSALFTSTHWSDRILGHSKIVDLPNRSVWIATGNNVKVVRDLRRRCVWINMDAKIARPWERKNSEFKHPQLLKWVLESRGHILSAVLTISRNWFVRGAPEWSGNPLGSFEEWSKCLGGILETAGVDGFLANYAEQMDKDDDDTSEWEAFLNKWADTLGVGKKYKGREVVEFMKSDDGVQLRDALPAELAVPFSQDDPLLSNLFGKSLGKIENVRHGDNNVHVTSPGSSKGTKTWMVLRDDCHDPGPKDPPPPPPPRKGGVVGLGGSSSSVQPRETISQQNVSTESQSDTSENYNPEERSGTQPTPPSHLGPGLQGPGQEDPTTSAHSSATNVQEIFPGAADKVYVATDEVLQQCVADIRSVPGSLGVDLETTDLRWWVGQIRLISITTTEGKTWVVDAFKVSPERVYRVLEENHCIFHNAGAFDVPYLLRAGCNPKTVGCTKVNNQLRYAGLDGQGHALVDIASKYLSADEAKEVKAEEVDHEAWSQPTLSPSDINYAVMDSRYLLAIYNKERETLDYVGMDRVADLEERFLRVVAEASATGMPVDPDRWGEVVQEAENRKRELFGELDALFRTVAGADVEVPEDFATRNKTSTNREIIGEINWGSTDQKTWAVESMNLTVPTKWAGKKKGYQKTFDKHNLNQIDHPIAELLGELQSIANFPTTFRRALEERFLDGWLYASWNQLEAATGRMSCSSPPMQGLPKKSKLREAIVAPEGWWIATFDFSQIEPRVLAALAQDKDLIKAFQGGEDIYKWAASKATGTPVEKVEPWLRSVFKIIVLGLSYGMSEFGLARTIRRDVDPDIGDEDVIAYRDAFFRAFKGIAAYHMEQEDTFEKAEKAGRLPESRTMLGRRRLNIENVRQLLNAPIQGSAADLFKLAATLVLERRAKTAPFKVVALIHDELVLLVEEEGVKEVETWVKAVMAGAAASIINAKLPSRVHIPVRVDSGYGRTLQGAKDDAERKEAQLAA